MICGSYSRVLLQAGHLLGLASLCSSNVNPQARHRAGTTSTWCPAARAERIACWRSSSTSVRLRPRSRASEDTDRGWSVSSVSRSLRKVMRASCAVDAWPYDDSDPSPECEHHCREQAAERRQVIPADRLPQIEVGEDRKHDQRHRLLNDFELIAGELTVTNAVRRDLKAVLAERNEPADEN